MQILYNVDGVTGPAEAWSGRVRMRSDRPRAKQAFNKLSEQSPTHIVVCTRSLARPIHEIP